MDPAINLLQQMSEAARNIRDNELATPQQDPTSPFLSPPSTSNSLYIVNSNQQPMSSDDRIRKLALKSQDADHRRRFERYLNDWGITRQSANMVQTTEEISDIVNNLLQNQGEDQVSEDDGRDEAAPNEEHSDFDQFYRIHGTHAGKHIGSMRDDDIAIVGNDDSDLTYTRSILPNFTMSVETTKPPKLPLNAQDSFLYWENDTKDRYQAPDKTIQYSHEPQWAVKKQPATKFGDAVSLRFDGLIRLEYEYGKKYKNNLSCFSNEFQILFTASNSEIFGYKINHDNIPAREPILKFDTKPNTTSERDRIASTWAYFPFTINFMKIDTFLNKEVLAVACDDGRVLVWFVDLLLKQAPNFAILSQERRFNGVYYSIKINPDFQLRVECSAWSVDFYNEHDMIAVSDNSRTVSIFYLEKSEAKFYTVTTHQLLHNIPDVCFIKDESTIFQENMLVFRISCASISCELVIFEFVMYRTYGPFLNHDHLSGTVSIDTDEDPVGAQRVLFESPKVVSRTLLDEDVWTVNYLDGRFFRRVNSFKSMVGDNSLLEDQLVSRFIRQNEKLDVESDPCVTSDLGLVAKFQYFPTDVEVLHGNTHNPGIMIKNFDTVNDRYRRIRKMYDSYYLHKQRSKTKTHRSLNGKMYWEPVVTTTENNKFLCVTSSSKLGLFNTERLLCVSSTFSAVFGFNLSFGEEASYSNRLSISCLVPELSCILVASQIGIVSLFRLCTHRGCHGMRQEYIFPNASRLALGDRGYRTITGLCVRRCGSGQSIWDTRFVIYITYIDGLVLCYGLSENENGLELDEF